MLWMQYLNFNEKTLITWLNHYDIQEDYINNVFSMKPENLLENADIYKTQFSDKLVVNMHSNVYSTLLKE